MATRTCMTSDYWTAATRSSTSSMHARGDVHRNAKLRFEEAREIYLHKTRREAGVLAPAAHVQILQRPVQSGTSSSSSSKPAQLRRRPPLPSPRAAPRKRPQRGVEPPTLPAQEELEALRRQLAAGAAATAPSTIPPPLRRTARAYPRQLLRPQLTAACVDSHPPRSGAATEAAVESRLTRSTVATGAAAAAAIESRITRSTNTAAIESRFLRSRTVATRLGGRRRPEQLRTPELTWCTRWLAYPAYPSRNVLER